MSSNLRVEQKLEIGNVAHGGTCIAHARGQTIFVSGALPGEIVDVEITKSNKKIAFGKVIRVHKASVERIVPACESYSECGGCDWLHTSYEYSRELKTRVLRDQLRRLAKLEETELARLNPQVLEVLPTRHWRTRMTYHQKGLKIGLYARQSNRVVAVPKSGCVAAVESISQPQKAGQFTQATSGVHYGGDVEIFELAAGHRWQLNTNSFWQIHLQAANLLSKRVLEFLAPEAGGLALDLFCGVGLFAYGLQQAGCRVIGIEGNREAVNYARKNVAGAEFYAGDVLKTMNRLRLAEADFVVLDPPRAGAKPDLMKKVFRLAAKRIVYVACDPAALARDISLARDYGYQIAAVQGLDLFPGTACVETVCLMTRMR